MNAKYITSFILLVLLQPSILQAEEVSFWSDRQREFKALADAESLRHGVILDLKIQNLKKLREVADNIRYNTFQLGRNTRTSKILMEKLRHKSNFYKNYTEGLSKIKESNVSKRAMLGHGLTVAGLALNFKDDLKKHGAGTATGFFTADALSEVANLGGTNPLAILSVGRLFTNSCKTEGLCMYLDTLIASASNPLGQTIEVGRLWVDTANIQADTLENELAAYTEFTQKINSFLKGGINVSSKKALEEALLSKNNTELKNSYSSVAESAVKKAEIMKKNIEMYIRTYKFHIESDGAAVKDIERAFLGKFVGTAEPLKIGIKNYKQYIGSLELYLKRINKFIDSINEKGKEYKNIVAELNDAWLLKEVFNFERLAFKQDLELKNKEKELSSIVEKSKTLNEITLKKEEHPFLASKPDAIEKPVLQKLEASSENQAKDNLLENVISGINQCGNSHFCAANSYSDFANPTPVTAFNNNNTKLKTGFEKSAASKNTIPYQSTGWVVTTGNANKHYSSGNQFGSITAPNGGVITALNNADVQQAVMKQVVVVPNGVKSVDLSTVANFVTNEYPKWVGSQYNDQALIEVKTGSGNVYQATLYNKKLNSSNFKKVNNLPKPMSSSGGQTGFEKIKKSIPVAGGGKLVITVKTVNVGDKAVPSATLVNQTTVK